MSDTNDNNAQAGNAGKFNIQKIYIKDISFEAPNAPQCFTEKWDPKNQLDLNTTTSTLAEHIYEVVLAITFTAKLNDKAAYLVEIQQAGIFHIEGFSEADLHGMLGSYCPTILFPYAREAISDIVTRGGFPQLLLTPINFDALYHQHMQQQAQGGKAQESLN